MTSILLPQRAHRMRRMAGMLVAVGLAMGVPSTAHATTSVTSGLVKCSVTALAPTVVSGKLTGWATVTCNRATTVEALLGVVELDGTVEDALVPIRHSSQFVKITTLLVGKAVKISTGTVVCVDTDRGEKEEYASKAMLNLSGAVSAWDRYRPSTNQFSC